MAKFDITRRLRLDFLGEAWKQNGCYLEFAVPSFGELLAMNGADSEETLTEKEQAAAQTEQSLEIMRKLFRKGTAMSEGKTVDVAPEELTDFPPDVVTRCFELMTGGVDPKSSESLKESFSGTKSTTAPTT